MPYGKYFKKELNFYLKEITKDEIEKLIKVGLLKNTSDGFVNPQKNYRVGYYRTKGAGGRRYIENWYADMAKKLN